MITHNDIIMNMTWTVLLLMVTWSCFSTFDWWDFAHYLYLNVHTGECCYNLKIIFITFSKHIKKNKTKKTGSLMKNLLISYIWHCGSCVSKYKCNWAGLRQYPVLPSRDLFADTWFIDTIGRLMYGRVVVFAWSKGCCAFGQAGLIPTNCRICRVLLVN